MSRGDKRFGVTDNLAVPVEEIAGLRVHSEGEFPARDLARPYLAVHTEHDEYNIEDVERAKRFVQSLSSHTDIIGARADDLLGYIDEALQEQ